MSHWEFWIDRGGTFTDCIGWNADSGELRVSKTLSSDTAHLDGIRELLGLEPQQPIPPCELRIGTTLATNALLERRGPRTALVVTQGFGDLPLLGDQTRPELFGLTIDKPQPLCSDVLEVAYRCDPSGSVLAQDSDAALRQRLGGLAKRGARSIAVVVLHSHANRAPERAIARVAQSVGFAHISLSHELSPAPGLLARCDTTLLDAFLTPVLRDWLQRVERELPQCRIRLMQSSGNLTTPVHFRGPGAILSGPAGGVVACARLAEALEVPQILGVDMGGTSTDVCRFAGEFERDYESVVDGVRIRAPVLRIETVAAGGGSICTYQGQRLTVGPRSAGATPGPMCYGHEQALELTLTDVYLLLGRLQQDRFPLGLDARPAKAKLRSIAAEVSGAAGRRTPEQVAEGFVAVANANMASAIRRVSVARGCDPRDHALVVLGGAGGQHACGLARELGIERVLFHPCAGVFSALGIGLASVGWNGEAPAERPFDAEELARCEAGFAQLQSEGLGNLATQGVTREAMRCTQRLDLRYRGTQHSLTVPAGSFEAVLSAFEKAHMRLFGYKRASSAIEILTLRVEVVADRDRAHEILACEPRAKASPALAPRARSLPVPRRFASIWLQGTWSEHVPLFDREALSEGDVIEGPALILESTGTILIEPDFTLRALATGLLELRPSAQPWPRHAPSFRAPGDASPDPVKLEIFGNHFMALAEQMGDILRRAACSTNIRERLDFSCAVFDPGGGLVANAPHIPVHLGAMAESVKGLLAAGVPLEPGDAYLTNDPAAGGSHLPDVTAISPIFADDGRLAFFTASRGHHADIGGVTPGSMPAFSRSLAEEGVVFRALRAVHRGRLARAEILAALRQGPHPARHPLENLADVEAQLAANQHGAHGLERLVAEHGLDTVQGYMLHVQANAAARVGECISALSDGCHRFADALDDGTPVGVEIIIAGTEMTVDFAATGPAHAGNFNAPRAVTVAALLYVLRCLVKAPIPLNSGCLAPIHLRIPKPSLLDPPPDAAVAAGNVETSQRVVDVLLGALGVAAASQGTMNNLSFGDDTFGYYETIAGGVGATEGSAGASGVHSHMTNTRITDPELLEQHYPVRLQQFSLRKGSGGRGVWSGGDGVVREFCFLRPARVSLLAQRRTLAPFGLHGGSPGRPGRHYLNGEPIAGCATLDVPAGSCLRIETPGGGGWGSASARPPDSPPPDSHED